jgi:hypothetical protein
MRLSEAAPRLLRGATLFYGLKVYNLLIIYLLTFKGFFIILNIGSIAGAAVEQLLNFIFMDKKQTLDFKGLFSF